MSHYVATAVSSYLVFFFQQIDFVHNKSTVGIAYLCWAWQGHWRKAL